MALIEENWDTYKKILTNIKEEIKGNIILVGDFNTTLTSKDRSTREKINKATEIQNDTIEKLDLNDIFRIIHPKKSENTLFSSVHGTCSRIDHILRHKANLNKFKTEIISSIFFEYNSMKLENNHRKRK